jgi:hypothetical protein
VVSEQGYEEVAVLLILRKERKNSLVELIACGDENNSRVRRIYLLVIAIGGRRWRQARMSGVLQIGSVPDRSGASRRDAVEQAAATRIDSAW